MPLGPGGPVSQAFWRPGQEEVLRPYAEQYLELLPGLDEGGMIPAMAYTHRLFPLFGIDEGYLPRAQAAAAGGSPVVRQGVAERADEVRRMLAARGAAG